MLPHQSYCNTINASKQHVVHFKLIPCYMSIISQFLKVYGLESLKITLFLKYNNLNTYLSNCVKIIGLFCRSFHRYCQP